MDQGVSVQAVWREVWKMTDFDRLEISENSQQDFVAIATEKAADMRRAIEDDKKKMKETVEELGENAIADYKKEMEEFMREQQQQQQQQATAPTH